ncbi:MAG: LysR family transcriptional regulator [Porticoccaceae bacterium]
MSQPRISLEQWAAFKAVVDEGSFARAAELLNKSQSSISYAVANLERMLPVPVFTREGRKAELTEAGRALYRRAAALLKQAEEVEKAAEYLASGWEAEVVLGVDALVPMERLFCALHRFSIKSPQTRLRVLETTLSGTAETLLNRTADLALISVPPPGFSGIPLGQVRMLAVAHPNHELLRQGPSITEEELRRHRQIVLRDTGARRQVDAGWLGSEQRWTVTHPASSLEAVKAGLGFAFLPYERVRADLAAGRLQALPLAWGERTTILNLVLANGDSAGPATQAVADELIREFEHPDR